MTTTIYRAEMRSNFEPGAIAKQFKWRVTRSIREGNLPSTLPKTVALVDTESHAKLIVLALNAETA